MEGEIKMKTNKRTSFTLPRWGVVIPALIAVAIIGVSGDGGAGASANIRESTPAIEANLQGQGLPDPDEPPVCPSGQCFEDVTAGNPYYTFTNRIYLEGLVSGYACGGLGEPCVPPNNRPYYRPAAEVSRGQMSKFIFNARNMPGIYMESAAFFPILSITDHPYGAGLWGTAREGAGKGVSGRGSGSGPSRDFYNLNAGIEGDGVGTDNSVGAVLRGFHDNAVWLGTEAASYYGLYIVHEKGGFVVGNSGDNARNDSYIGGDLSMGGNCNGCVLVSVMQNTGAYDLHSGEVASLVSASEGPSTLAGKPLAGVDRSQGAYSTAVMGVITYRWIPPDPNAPEGSRLRTGYYDRDATTIKSSEYMGVATSGSHKEIKVSDAGGPIRVGDLLVASDTPGVAMKADPKETTFGSIIGKALAALESGEGTIPVLLTLK
jgi:hypothetical protein